MTAASVQSLGKAGHFFSNWATSYSCRPELYFEPENIEQLRQIVCHARQKGKRVKVVGHGRSPSDIACTTDYMVSLRKLNSLLQVDQEKCTAKVQGGMLVSELNQSLTKNGMALSVLGSISDITVTGAISTGTHGTGAQFGIISTFVLELELMTASGEILKLSRHRDQKTFLAACLGLGALGIILTVTLQCEKSFKLHQTEYPLKLQDVLEHVNVHVTSSDHFRFMWYPHTDDCVMYHMRRTNKATFQKPNWFYDVFIGYYLLEFLYWISTFIASLIPVINRAYFNGLNKTSKETVDISYNIFNFDCRFKQYVMEWAFPSDKTAWVVLKLKAWIENSGFKTHFPVEVRFVKSDDILLSPAYGTDSCYINIVMYRPYNKFVAHGAYWKAFEDIVKEAGGRPHWAKDHNVSADQLKDMYPKWETFCDIRRKLDPSGLFLNDYLERIFGGHR